jgi:hypothetical protein
VTIALRHAEGDAENALCFPVMRELRPTSLPPRL